MLSIFEKVTFDGIITLTFNNFLRKVLVQHEKQYQQELPVVIICSDFNGLPL